MASDRAVEKRANLLASRARWSNVDLPGQVQARDGDSQGNGSAQDSVREWLTTTVNEEEDAKQAQPRNPAEPLRRNPSSEDDLALGVEASLYGKQGVRTVQEFLRSTRSSPALSRWTSFNSGHSGPLSVMDVLNLWNDDPEEVLLDLGFGCDEPDISGRIPARFINHQSRARGISIQVFLEAQKNRLDLENPDVSNRFRQLEVLQQVTTAFSSLVGPPSGPPSGPPAPGRDQSAESRERRRRMGMLLRRASKKTLSQSHNPQDPIPETPTSPGVAPQPEQPPTGLADKQVPLKRPRPSHQDSVCLTPVVEKQEPQSQEAQEGVPRLVLVKEGHPLTSNIALQRKRSPGQARESFEMEEIHSFDEGSITGSYAGGAENAVWGVMRTNSCQSDSSGFLEEPFIPYLTQQPSPGPELIKALSSMSGSSADNQITVRDTTSAPPSPTSLASPSHPSSHLPSSPTSPPVLSPSTPEAGSLGLKMSLLPSPSPPPESASLSPTSPSLSTLLPKPDAPLERREEAASSPENPRPPSDMPASPECVSNSPPPVRSFSPEFEDGVHYQSPPLPSPVSATSPSSTSSSVLSPFVSCPMALAQASSPLGRLDKMQIGENRSLSSFSHEFGGEARSPSPSQPSTLPSTTSLTFPTSLCPSSLDPTHERPLQTDSSLGSPEVSQTSTSDTSPLTSHATFSPESEDEARSSSLLACHRPSAFDPISTCLPLSDPLRSPEETQAEETEFEGSPTSPPSTEEEPSTFSPELGCEAPSQNHSPSLNLPSPASYCPSSLLPQADSPLGSPEEVHTEDSEASLLSSPSPFFPELGGKAHSPSHPPTFYYPSSSNVPVPTCLPQADSPLESPEKTQIEGGVASPPPSPSPALPQTETQTDKEQAPLLTSLSSSSSTFREDDAPPFSSHLSAPSKFEDDLTPTSPTSPVGEKDTLLLLSVSSPSPVPGEVTGSDVGRAPDPVECSITPDDSVCRDSGRPCHNDDNADSAPDFPDQIVIKAETDRLATATEDSPQEDRVREATREGEVERGADTVQTTEAGVYVTGPDSSAVLHVGSRIASQEILDDTEIEPQGCSSVSHDEVTGEKQLEQSRTASQAAPGETEIEPQDHYSVFRDEVPDGMEPEQKVHGPIEIESLDLVFETSVDGSEVDGDYGDVDAICRELDSDGHVFWAEPVQLPSPSRSLESGSFEASEKSTMNATDLSSSTDKATYLSSPSPTSPNTASALSPDGLLITQPTSLDTTTSMSPAKSLAPTLATSSFSPPTQVPGQGSFRSSRSVSVQMPSSLSSHSVSHIVHRKDVPYTAADPTPAPLPAAPSLDTSTPLRAVLSWTDQQLQRNAEKPPSCEGLRTLPSQGATAKPTKTSKTVARPAGMSSSMSLLCPFPSLSNNGLSHDSLPGTKSVSLDTGLWPEKEVDEEVERGRDGDEDRRWEGALMSSAACCCSCDHRCACCLQNSPANQHAAGNFPYSLDELEGMMHCLRKFRSVLTDIEEQISEDQASVFKALSDADRDEVRDITELRKAVKQEAGELELQLNELAHHHDDSFKLKMHRLLNEQSLLCSQLRLLPPTPTPTPTPTATATKHNPASTKSVATQCCLLPWLPLTDVQSARLSSQGTWDMESSRHSEGMCEALGCSPTKSDKLDFVGFLQRLKESLRHSVNTDSLE